MSTYFDERETMSRAEREAYDNTRLTEMVRLGYERSTRVRSVFQDRGMMPSDIRSVEDLVKLPIVSREQLVGIEAEDPPFGGLTDPNARIERIFTSPGPVYEPHLGSDDPLWARAYTAAGFKEGDVVLNAFSYHMVAAGLTFHGGLNRVGATVVPSGTSGTQQQVELIKDLNVTGYTGTPSFLMSIIEKAFEMGFVFAKDFAVRRACFGAEPLPPSLRQRFETEFGIDTYQMYGATEVGDIAYECSAKNGWHICEEVIVEIVDPVTGVPMKPGELGEVVVTRLNSVFFLFRFGTGDLSSLMESPCSCGRTSYKLSGIAGRVGDAVKVRGMFVAPSQLKRIAELFPGIAFQIVVNRSGHRDTLAVMLDTKAAELDRSALQAEFRRVFQEICAVRIDTLEFTQPSELGVDAKLIRDERAWK
ncbi:MAG: AMP-binding protein [Deltaproteobacteria bacterium]|nr:AMP-binding protein [Deltaproteobacteria bacterium]